MDQVERNERLESAVREAVDDQIERDRADRAQSPPRGKRQQGGLIVLLLLSWAAIGWIWSTRPAFIFGPEAGGLSAERQEASLRFGMVLEQARAREFKERTGRWPASLVELGDEVAADGVVGMPSGAGFLITGAAGDVHLELTDRMDSDSFLGESLEILRTDR